MNIAASKGVLVLFCRSKAARNFDWVKPALSEKLQRRFGNKIQFVEISTPSELVNNLLNPVTLFDIDEVHLLAEYEPGRVLIDAANDRFIEAGKIAQVKKTKTMGLAGGQLLTKATIKLWYLSNSDKPNMAMLNEWSRYFDRRINFLPFIQLKKQLTPQVKKTTPQKSSPKATVKRASSAKNSFSGHLSVTKIIMILCVIGGVNHFVSYQSEQREFESTYDQVVDYEDSFYDIELATKNLQNNKGDLIEHSWIFQRTRWDFSFFVAREWLYASDKELDAAAGNRDSGNNYWATVYQRLIKANDDRLSNVADALKNQGQKLNLNNHDMATFVLSFVQHIPYKIPNNNLELLAPPQTVNEGYGDCDSKSLLYALIMRKLGYDTVMYINSRLRHAMAGVSTTSTGQFLASRGVRYYFAETTAIGYRIGQMRDSPSGWQLIPL